MHVAQRQTKVRKVESELSTKLGREPTDEEIAAEAKIDVEEVAELRELTRGLTSLDQPVGEEARPPSGIYWRPTGPSRRKRSSRPSARS